MKKQRRTFALDVISEASIQTGWGASAQLVVITDFIDQMNDNDGIKDFAQYVSEIVEEELSRSAYDEELYQQSLEEED